MTVAKRRSSLDDALRQRAGHDDKDQHRGNALQGTDEQAAEAPPTQPAPGNRQRQHRADDQTA